LKTHCCIFVGSRFPMLLALAIVLASGMPACNSAKKTLTDKGNVSGPAAAVQTGTFHGVGVVKSIKIELSSIELDHQDIPGLMPAMTMEFYVKDRALLAGLNPGDRVEFMVENGVGGLKITSIRRL
jgi:Cu/Ag efflux protein CusF